ncbi:MAG: adenosylmethionine decarboxylase [Phycisphaerae bacterium]|nr:adenosylmethionine decarboxylase [Phycisphaerae bacterium]
MHCILELYGCPADLLNDALFVRETIEEASQQSLSTILKLTSHQFYPQGVTAIALLAESHLSIHTWPEHGYAAVDIFTCGEDARPQQACRYLVERLSARKHSLVVLPRGVDAPERIPALNFNPSEELDLCRTPE